MSSDPERNIEAPERLIALVALNTQPLPERTPPEQAASLVLGENATEAEIAALHACLDADPAAFERFLELHRAKPALASIERRSRAFEWLAMFRRATPRYALAFGVALVAVLIALPLYQRESPRLADLERSSSELLSRVGPSAWVVELPVSVGGELGFSPRVQVSARDAASFMDGWNAAERRLREQSVEAHEGAGVDAYFLLGQWNRLLSVAAEAHDVLGREFWQAQLRRERALAQSLREQPDLDPVVATHLRRVESRLSSLANGERPARSARELADELRWFRSGFLAPTPVGP